MSQKKKLVQKKNIWRNYDRKVSKFGERHTFADSRSVNTKQEKHKENHAQTHQIIKLRRTKDKGVKKKAERQKDNILLI